MGKSRFGPAVSHKVRVGVGDTDIHVVIRVGGPDKDSILEHLTGLVRKAVQAEHGIAEAKGGR